VKRASKCWNQTHYRLGNFVFLTHQHLVISKNSDVVFRWCLKPEFSYNTPFWLELKCSLFHFRSKTLESADILLCNEDLDQSCVATGSSGVQRRPQLVVLGVDAGSSVQKDLHHLLIVIYTTLEWKRKLYCRCLNICWCNTSDYIRYRKKVGKRSTIFIKIDIKWTWKQDRRWKLCNRYELTLCITWNACAPHCIILRLMLHVILPVSKPWSIDAAAPESSQEMDEKRLVDTKSTNEWEVHYKVKPSLLKNSLAHIAECKTEKPWSQFGHSHNSQPSTVAKIEAGSMFLVKLWCD